MSIYHNSTFFILLFAAVLILHISWIKLPLLFSRQSEKIKISNRVLDAVFCINTAVVFGTALHLYPGNNFYPAGDSAVFVYIGKQMLAGKIPYLDLFDHKGPVLYLIQQLGLWVTPGSYTGLWICEVLNMAVSLAFMIQFCRVIDEHKNNAYSALLATFVVCAWATYEGGNFAEEYALPWISMSLWIFFLFFKTGKIQPRQIILLGIGFSIVFLLRANMIAVWVSLIPVVIGHLLREKRYFDLIKCTGLFLLGILLVAMPILFWSLQKGFLQEMQACYLGFNILYSKANAMNLEDMLALNKFFLHLLFPGTVALMFSITVYRHDKLQWINLWYFLVSLMMLEMSGRDYPHYLIIQLPALVIGFLGFFQWSTQLLQNGVNQQKEPKLLILFSCFCLLAAVFGYRQIKGNVIYPEPKSVDWLMENTEETDDVLVLGCGVETYLEANRTTNNRFFYQTPPIEISEELCQLFLKELTLHQPDVVISTIPDGVEDDNWLTKVYDLLLEQQYVIIREDDFIAFERPSSH